MSRWVVPATRRELPAWPVLGLFGGLLLWWALGAMWLVPTAAAAIMLVLMIRRGARWLPGMGPWVAMVLWVIACSVTLLDVGSVNGYALRFLDVADATVVAFYVASARHSLPRVKILSALCLVWLTVVVLGYAAMLEPGLRLSTIFGKLMPGSLASNPLVADLVNPPLAEVQQPFGAEKPFNRPAAPFPYANSWGMTYAMLTPVVVARLALVRSRWWRAAGAVVLLISLGPALATSNRGMLAALAVSLLVAALRLALDGKHGAAFGIIAAGGLAGVVAVVSGAIDSILERLTHSSSTGDRFLLYERTLDRVVQRPWLGHASPEMDPVVGVQLGTQGMIWLLLFCFGIPALLFFVWFIAGVMIRGWHVPDTAGAWLYSVIPAVLVMIPFYSLGTVPMSVFMVICVTILKQAKAPRKPSLAQPGDAMPASWGASPRGGAGPTAQLAPAAASGGVPAHAPVLVPAVAAPPVREERPTPAPAPVSTLTSGPVPTVSPVLPGAPAQLASSIAVAPVDVPHPETAEGPAQDEPDPGAESESDARDDVAVPAVAASKARAEVQAVVQTGQEASEEAVPELDREPEIESETEAEAEPESPVEDGAEGPVGDPRAFGPEVSAPSSVWSHESPARKRWVLLWGAPQGVTGANLTRIAEPEARRLVLLKCGGVALPVALLAPTVVFGKSVTADPDDHEHSAAEQPEVAPSEERLGEGVAPAPLPGSEQRAHATPVMALNDTRPVTSVLPAEYLQAEAELPEAGHLDVEGLKAEGLDVEDPEAKDSGTEIVESAGEASGAPAVTAQQAPPALQGTPPQSTPPTALATPAGIISGASTPAGPTSSVTIPAVHTPATPSKAGARPVMGAWPKPRTWGDGPTAKPQESPLKEDASDAPRQPEAEPQAPTARRAKTTPVDHPATTAASVPETGDAGAGEASAAPAAPAAPAAAGGAEQRRPRQRGRRAAAAAPAETKGTAKTSLATFGLVVTGAVLAFGTTMLVGNVAGDAAAGVFFQVIAYFNLAVVGTVFGADTGLVREVSARMAVGRTEDLRPLLKMALIPVAIASGLLALAMWILAPSLERLAPGVGLADAIRIAAPLVPFGSLMTVLFGALRGMGKVRQFSVLQNLALPLLRLGAVTAALVLGAGLIPLSAAWALPVAPVLVLAAVAVMRAAKSARKPRGRRARHAAPVDGPPQPDARPEQEPAPEPTPEEAQKARLAELATQPLDVWAVLAGTSMTPSSLDPSSGQRFDGLRIERRRRAADAAASADVPFDALVRGAAAGREDTGRRSTRSGQPPWWMAQVGPRRLRRSEPRPARESAAVQSPEDHAAQLAEAARKPPTARRFWAFCSARGVSAWAEAGLEWVDVLLVGIFLGPAAAGAYGAVNRCVRMGTMLDQTARIVTGPLVSSAMARGDAESAKTVYGTTTRVLVAAAWPFFLILAVFAPLFLSLFGQGFTVAAGPMSMISVAMMLAVSSGGVQSVLLMAGRARWQLINKLSALAVVIVVCLLLIPVWGLWGAVTGWAAGVLVDTGLATAQAWLRLGFVPPYRQVLPAALTAVLCVGGVGLLARFLLGPSWLALAVTILIGGGAYLRAVLLYPAWFGMEDIVDKLAKRIGLVARLRGRAKNVAE